MLGLFYGLGMGMMIALVGLAFLIGFIIPIIIIVKCAISERSITAKIVWILGMILFWPLTGYIYCAIHAKTGFKRIMGALVAILLIGLLAAGIMTTDWSRHSNDINNPDRVKASIEDVIKGAIFLLEQQKATDENKKALESVILDLKTLEDELKDPANKDVFDMKKVEDLVLFSTQIRTVEDLPRWNAAFANRKSKPAVQ